MPAKKKTITPVVAEEAQAVKQPVKIREKKMTLTAIGLPNTCAKCGTPCADLWYAVHEDAARSGQGFCAECAE